MKIKVKLFANLVKFSPNPKYSGAPFLYEMKDGMTFADLINDLQLPEEDVKILFVNGIICEKDRVLQEGDEVGIFPPVGGGSGGR